jgi:hypothetical protein
MYTETARTDNFLTLPGQKTAQGTRKSRVNPGPPLGVTAKDNQNGDVALFEVEVF